MRFRSVNGIYLPEPLGASEMYGDQYCRREAEGTFFWGESVIKDWTGRHLAAIMPYWTPREHRWVPWHFLLVVRPGEPHPPCSNPVWQWDGNVEKPTLSPSIGCGHRPDFHWHGYLRAGRFEACKE